MTSVYKAEEAKAKQALDEYNKRKEENARVSLAQIAREFGVSFSRLHARIHGRGSKSDRKRVNLWLNDVQHEVLFEHLDTLNEYNITITPKMIKDAAENILHLSDPAGPPPKLSKNWTYRFMEQHPQYANAKRSAKSDDTKGQTASGDRATTPISSPPPTLEILETPKTPRSTRRGVEILRARPYYSPSLERLIRGVLYQSESLEFHKELLRQEYPKKAEQMKSA